MDPSSLESNLQPPPCSTYESLRKASAEVKEYLIIGCLWWGAGCLQGRGTCGRVDALVHALEALTLIAGRNSEGDLPVHSEA